MAIRHGIIYQRVSFSPAWLNRRVAALCKDLQQDGVKAGDTLITDASPLPTVLLTHAADKLNCRMASFDPQMPPSRRDAFISAARTPRPRHSPDTRLVLATSGSSGQPKAVLLTQDAVRSSANAVCQRLEVTANDVWLCCLPLFHIGGLALLHRCTASGATLLLHDKFDPVKILQDIQRYHVTCISLVPSMLQRLLEAQECYPLPKSLRIALIGGAALPEKLAEQAIKSGWPVCPTYGMTETCSIDVQIIHFQKEPHNAQQAKCCDEMNYLNVYMVAVCYPPPASWRAGQAGQVLEHLTIDFGEEQRILVRGDSLMAGYAYPDSPFMPLPSGAWLESGDAGCLDTQGQLVVHGRLDNIIISGGENVHPRQVEESLLQHPRVENVMVGSKPDAMWGNVLVAAFTGQIEETELLSWSKQYLQGAFRPRRFIKLDRLPLNAQHKPDYRLLFS